MKKILIFSHTLEIGGAERALLGLLENIDTKKYQVDLFLMRHEGDMIKDIPSGIRLLPDIPQYKCLAIPFAEVLKNKQFGMAFGRYIGKRKAKKRVKKLKLPSDNDVLIQFSHKYTLPFVPMISQEEYDLAVSFLTPHYFVSEKVKAKKKLAWIHTDYSTIAVDRESQFAMWEKYDGIVSISDEVTKAFVSLFPKLQQKVIEIPNIIPIDYINLLKSTFSVESEMPCNGSIKLLSIGRFCKAKNFDNIPEICNRIRKCGLNIKWYLIGYGKDKELIEKKIVESGMEGIVIILGKRINPYPYIQACDLYVQPSRYEGKSVSVIEAQVLGKPVVITDYPTSKSQLINGYDGVIVPMNNEECAKGIAELLFDKGKIEIIKGNIVKNNYAKEHETLETLYRLIG